MPASISLPLDAGARQLRVGLDLSPGLAPVEPTALDLSSAPGVQLALQRAWSDGSARLELVCATGAGESWVAGLEAAVLSGATALTRKHLGMAALRADAPAASPHGFDQVFAAETAAAVARGRHLLRFFGSEQDVLLCTVACQHEPAAAASARVCSTAVDSLVVTGELAAPPAPGALASALAIAADHPWISGAAVALVVVAAVAVLLRGRPRPRY